jgi:Zn-dependent peptidase ImmA (M78 family)
MAEHPDDFFTRLQALCHEAGVKVVYTPCLPHAPMNGCTRWLGDTPLIQLSGRHKRNDIFWFTFFHEAGHILKHGKKEIFLEEEGNNRHDKEKEAEADRFAVEHTFTEAEEQQVIEALPLLPVDIEKFAKKFNTHPAIIVGRLARKGYYHDSFGFQNEFYKEVNFSNLN